jgi:hypothetical protein
MKNNFSIQDWKSDYFHNLIEESNGHIPSSTSTTSVQDMNLGPDGKPARGGLREDEYGGLSPEAIDRMNGLVSEGAVRALIHSTRIIIRDLKTEGFDEDEIFDYIVSKIKTLSVI